MTPIDPHKYSGPLEEIEKRTHPGKRDPRIAIIIGILVLLVGGGILAFVIASEGGINGIDEDDIFSFLPAIPVWLFIFIPLMFVKKKKVKTNSEQKRVLAFLVAGLVLLVALTFGLVIYFAN